MHMYVNRSLFFSDHYIKQIDSMLPWVCSVLDHRGHQNVVKTLMTHSPVAPVPLLCLCHILTSSVNRCTATWNLHCNGVMNLII